jgi:proton-translocating NADH-quinone oxidoreductase chain N
MDVLLIFAFVLSVQKIFFKKYEKIAGVFAIVAFCISFFFVSQFLFFYKLPYIISLTDILPTVTSYFRIDLFSIFLAVLSLSIGIIITLYNLQYPSNKKISYYILLLLCVFGILGIAFSYDFFSLMVFWEIMAVNSYFLITFGGERSEKVALKYIFISIVGSAFLIFSLSLIFSQAHSLNFLDVANFVKTADSNLMKFIFVLSMVCFAIKSGIVPFHTWVPDTYQEAYSPTSALFSSLLSKVGLFALLRLIFVFVPVLNFIQTILILLAIVSMLLGNILALFEQDLKRLLAFSSIAHIGYILFAISLFTENSLSAGLLHMINHAVVKVLLFLIAGTCLFLTGKKKIEDMSGIGRINKIFGFGIIVGVFTIMGLPGLPIFMSEFQIVLAGLEAGYFIPVFILVFNILLSAVYYVRILRELVIKKPHDKVIKQIPIALQLSILILILICILLGLYPGFAIDFNKAVIASIL